MSRAQRAQSGGDDRSSSDGKTLRYGAGPRAPRFRTNDWLALLFVAVLACAVRVVFFSGLLGSDDVDYADRALAILHGEWSTTSTYISYLRYGVILPMVSFMALFGPSEFTANLWALVCSIGEVAIVFVIARYIWGLRAGVMAALVLGLLPLHVNLSGRVLADTPLAFFITLCFAAFYFAERSGSRALYLAAGLSLGAVYWVKEVVPPLIVPLFFLYAIMTWTFRKEWLWAVAGATLMLLLNMALMWGIAGDPLQVLHAVNRAVPTLASLENVDRSPGYYLYRLFVDVRHTWLMPYLAVAGVLLCCRDRRTPKNDIGYILLWGMGLLLILSFAVVSVSPFRLLSKHNYYMLIFAAPLALFAGYALSVLKGKALAGVLILLVGGSLLLSALQQQAIRVFTANSRATIAFAAQHPGVTVYASTNADALSSTVSALGGQWPGRTNIRPSAELAAKKPVPADAEPETADGEPAAYVILDMETLGRGRDHLRIAPEDVPSCWKYVETLQPQGFGVGRSILGVLRRAAEIVLPERLAQKALSATERIFRPREANVYAVLSGCNIERRSGG